MYCSQNLYFFRISFVFWSGLNESGSPIQSASKLPLRQQTKNEKKKRKDLKESFLKCFLSSFFPMFLHDKRLCHKQLQKFFVVNVVLILGLSLDRRDRNLTLFMNLIFYTIQYLQYLRISFRPCILAVVGLQQEILQSSFRNINEGKDFISW